MEENITILVVDDEDRIRRLLNMYLTREGYTVDEAVDGAEALEKRLKMIIMYFIRSYDARKRWT